MIGRLFIAMTLATASAGLAVATPYWVAYEGNAFPETKGWERVYGGGGSNRSIVGGNLVLDSLQSDQIYDAYLWRQQINPALGEMFICEWHAKVNQSNGIIPDQALAIARDGGGTLSIMLGYDYVSSEREPWVVPLPPGQWHDYVIQSTDMLAYTLLVDGVSVVNGTWDLNSLNESFVGFGDSHYGGTLTSSVEWDYVRFGVIPEPTALQLVAVAACITLIRRRYVCSAEHSPP